MKARVNGIRIDVQSTLEISVEEAEILEFLTSYDLLKIFEEKYSKRFTADKMRDTLHNFRDELRTILQVRDQADKAIVEAAKDRARRRGQAVAAPEA